MAVSRSCPWLSSTDIDMVSAFSDATPAIESLDAAERPGRAEGALVPDVGLGVQ